MIEAETRTLEPPVRLQLARFEDGWGWRAWDECVGGEWRPLPAPARENRGRRFCRAQDAERFFQLLAMFLSDTETECISASPVAERHL